MTRLSIELTPDQHRKIKVMASMKGMKIKDFVLEQVLPEKASKKGVKDMVFTREDGTKLHASKKLRQALKELDAGDVLRYKNPEEFFAKYGI